MVFSGIFGGHRMHHPDPLSGLKNFFPPLLGGLLIGSPQSSLEMALGWRELSRLKLHPHPVGSLQATTVGCGNLEECQGQSLNCRKPSNLQRSLWDQQRPLLSCLCIQLLPLPNPTSFASFPQVSTSRALPSKPAH